MEWYCKYCNKTINKKRKDDHRQIKRHKINARWHKYFKDIDEAMIDVKDKYDQGLISVDEFNQIEQEVYNKVDELDSEGHYSLIPDSD